MYVGECTHECALSCLVLPVWIFVLMSHKFSEVLGIMSSNIFFLPHFSSFSETLATCMLDCVICPIYLRYVFKNYFCPFAFGLDIFCFPVLKFIYLFFSLYGIQSAEAEFFLSNICFISRFFHLTLCNSFCVLAEIANFLMHVVHML